MPLYSFEDTETGELVEHSMRMDDAVPIGEERVIDGRRLRRLCDYGASALIEPEWAHVAYSLGDEQIKHAPRTVSIEGEKFAAFRNKREILEFEARCEAHGIKERYDLGIFRK